MSPNFDGQATRGPQPNTPPLPPRVPVRPPLRAPGPVKGNGADIHAKRTARAKRTRPGWTKALEKAVHSFVESRLKVDFAPQIAQNERGFKDLTVRLLRRSLPPGPGRPRRADVTEALRLEGEGATRKEIYIRLRKVTRDEKHALTEAMRQRRARTRKRDKSADVTPTNPA